MKLKIEVVTTDLQQLSQRYANQANALDSAKEEIASLTRKLEAEKSLSDHYKKQVESKSSDPSKRLPRSASNNDLSGVDDRSGRHTESGGDSNAGSGGGQVGGVYKRLAEAAENKVTEVHPRNLLSYSTHMIACPPSIFLLLYSDSSPLLFFHLIYMYLMMMRYIFLSQLQLRKAIDACRAELATEQINHLKTSRQLHETTERVCPLCIQLAVMLCSSPLQISPIHFLQLSSISFILSFTPIISSFLTYVNHVPLYDYSLNITSSKLLHYALCLMVSA